jgi:hypothetical protein
MAWGREEGEGLKLENLLEKREICIDGLDLKDDSFKLKGKVE